MGNEAQGQPGLQLWQRDVFLRVTHSGASARVSST